MGFAHNLSITIGMLLLLNLHVHCWVTDKREIRDVSRQSQNRKTNTFLFHRKGENLLSFCF